MNVYNSINIIKQFVLNKSNNFWINKSNTNRRKENESFSNKYGLSTLRARKSTTKITPHLYLFYSYCFDYIFLWTSVVLLLLWFSGLLSQRWTSLIWDFPDKTHLNIGMTTTTKKLYTHSNKKCKLVLIRWVNQRTF